MLRVGLFGGGCETEGNICEIALTRWRVYDLVLKNVWALELYILGQAWPLPSCVTAGRSPHLCEPPLGKDNVGKKTYFLGLFLAVLGLGLHMWVFSSCERGLF